MQETITRVAAGGLALLFAWAAGAKLIGFGQWRGLLERYRLPAGIDRVAAAAVPVTELAVTVVIVAVDLRAGAALGLALLSTFSLAVLRARALQGDRLPCGCFGRASVHDYRWILGRNLVLGLLAAPVLVWGEPASLLDGFDASGADALPALLVVAGVALALWTVSSAASSLRGREHP